MCEKTIIQKDLFNIHKGVRGGAPFRRVRLLFIYGLRPPMNATSDREFGLFQEMLSKLVILYNIDLK